jgi:thiamine biosynthesis lipoprotein
MRSRSKSEIRRCRPLLGTFVEITARGKTATNLERAVDAAFSAVAKVHRLMSFHDPLSDVSRINRHAFPKGITVHQWTWQVMNAARKFAQLSGGVFDVAVEPLFTGRDDPRRLGPLGNRHSSWRDILSRKNCEIIFRRRTTVNLGGIAKGFAVDRAVAVLKSCGVEEGLVNAGGDIRIFGSASRKVHLRNPACPAQFCGMLRVRNRAVATSATYFASGALIDGQTRRRIPSSISVTVAARDCMTADALTKIVFTLRSKAAPLLERCGADALVLERDGSPGWAFHTHAT